MIFHDTVDVAVRVGDVVTVTSVPGDVFPLDTDSVLAVATGGATVVTGRYRIVLAPAIAIPAKIDPVDIRFGWGAFPLNPVPISYGSGLQLDGHVERHTLRGRLHHYELITKNVMA